MPRILSIFLLMLSDVPPNVVFAGDAPISSKHLYWTIIIASALCTLLMAILSVKHYFRRSPDWSRYAICGTFSLCSCALSVILLFYPDFGMITNCFGPIGNH